LVSRCISRFALTATLVFYALSRRIAFLRTAPLWLIGPLYGTIVFCAMNYGTLPALSWVRSLYLHTAPRWPGSMAWTQLWIPHGVRWYPDRLGRQTRPELSAFGGFMKFRDSVLAVFVAAVVCATSLALTAVGADTYPRQPGIRVLNYTFDFTLTDASNEMVVKEDVDVQFVAAGVRTIELDLCKFSAQPRPPQMADGFADPCAEPGGGGGGGAAGRAGGAAAPAASAGPSRAGGKGMTVTAVTAGPQSLTWQHDGDRLKVTMPRAFTAGDRFTFSVGYHGVPATGILIADNKYGDRGWVSNPWPNKARNFRAVIDHPSMKASHVTSVTAPRKYQVVSNGFVVEQTDLPGDLRRTVWKESVPICTWLMSLAVAPFAVDHFGNYRGIALSSWVFPQEREAGLRAFAAHTQPVLEFYIDRIGPYAYEKLAQVQANGVGGGMELASSIFYGYGGTGAGRQLIAHEMAHQYFGDAVTEADWDDVWLSEGFATYFALLYQEFEDGHDAFVDGVRRSKAQAVNYALANPDSTIVHRNLADISKVISNNAQIYQGGAQVLQNIRGVVGTATFWAGIRSYYARYMNGNATRTISGARWSRRARKQATAVRRTARISRGSLPSC
jgi:hypothetical protein